MPDQYAIAERQRAALQRGDRAVARQVLDAYRLGWKAVEPALEDVTARIAAAIDAGEDVTPALLYEHDRLLRLQQEVAAEVSQIADRLGEALPEEQRLPGAEAVRDARALASAVALRPGSVQASFGGLSPATVESMVGFLSDGSPLRDLLDTLGPDAARRVGNALVRSAILGQNPRRVAREARAAFAGNAARALLISRDAIMRAYGEATHRSYTENTEIVAGWRWCATLSPRTCPACLALHGTLHPVDERLREHPAGRCTQLPVLRDEVTGEPFRMESGADWFVQQPAEVRRAIVGPRKLAALAAGEITLDDLAELTEHPRWGPSWGEASLSQAKATAQFREAFGAREVFTRTSVPGMSEPPPAVRPPAAWGAWTTLVDAEEAARARFPRIEFDFAGLHVDTVNPTLRQFATLAEEWPQVAERLEYLGGYKRVPPPGARQGFSSDDTWAHASRDGKRIGLNPVWYGDPGRFERSLRQAAAQGFHPTGEATIESVMTHEFGHQVQNLLQAQPGTLGAFDVVGIDGTGLVNDTLRQWVRTHTATRTLSGYALESAEEGWAEGFAAQYHGAPAVKRLTYVKKQRALLAALHPKNWRPKEQWRWVSDVPHGAEREAAWQRLEQWRKGFE